MKKKNYDRGEVDIRMRWLNIQERVRKKNNFGCFEGESGLPYGYIHRFYCKTLSFSMASSWPSQKEKE
jgi:hypothetical protein